MKKVLPIALLLMTSCVSLKTQMDSWLGANKHDLIMQMGLPDKSGSDGAGGEVFVYGKQVYVPASYFYDNSGASHLTSEAKTYWLYKIFFADSNGKIYRWMTQQQQAPPQQIDLNIFIN